MVDERRDSDGPLPKGWSWRDRARGSVITATTLDPGSEPLDGIEAFQTVYVPHRLLVSLDPDDKELDREGGPFDRVRGAARAFGWGSCRSSSTAPTSTASFPPRGSPAHPACCGYG